ncbi:MAG: TIGR04540 family protein [Dysgonamonadaceae bacterium]|nr:TIGR04540 family protein [Dysgonamonadaceae bacterium]
MITYFKNQIEVAEALKTVIDNYWEMKVEENDLITYIKQVGENNRDLIFKNNEYSLVVKQRLGIKRLRLVSKILDRG